MYPPYRIQIQNRRATTVRGVRSRDLRYSSKSFFQKITMSFYSAENHPNLSQIP
jgi:hypothetical protein